MTTGMLGSTTTGSGNGHVDAEAVVEAFAAMLQVGFLYPANNPRVTDASARLADAVSALAAATGPVVITVESDALLIGGERFERPRADVTWTLDRLARAHVTSVTLAGDLDPGVLIEFAIALRKSFPPSAPPFEQIWCHDGHGVTLELGSRTTPTPGPADSGPEQPAPSAPHRSSRSRRNDPVLAGMARSPKVRETLGQIHRRFEEEYEGAESFDAAGMLEQLASELPDAVRSDPRSACARIEAVLDLVLAQIDGFLLARPEDPASRLNDVASTLLHRQLPISGSAPPAPQKPRARHARSRQPRDDAARRVTDDLPALIRELDALAPAADLNAELDGAGFDDELLGTALHLLTHGRDTEVVSAGIVRLTDHLMANPSSRQRQMLGAYLRVAREGTLESDEARQRLVAFLQGNGVRHLLAVRETLDAEQVARTFPTQLVGFIDALELKGSRSERSFQELCDAVGDDALTDACRVLIEDGTLLTPNRTEKLLRFGGRRAARVAMHFVRTGATWTRAQVINYLRRQGLPRSESAVLAIVQPVTALPPAYLVDLCASIATGEINPKLHGYTSLLLRQYVRDTAERPGDLDRRVYAIRALGFWANPETVQYLEQLAKEGRILQQGKEARVIRQAATEALAQIRSPNEGAA